jgi:hypothetical protein
MGSGMLVGFLGIAFGVVPLTQARHQRFAAC